MTYTEIQDIVKISSGSHTSILLDMRRLMSVVCVSVVYI